LPLPDQVFYHSSENKQQRHENGCRSHAQHDGVTYPVAEAFTEAFGFFQHSFLDNFAFSQQKEASFIDIFWPCQEELINNMISFLI
jgi:hypothetical protein